MQFKFFSTILPLLTLSAASPIAVSEANLAKRVAEPNSWPPAGTPTYTDCSFVQQIGLVNVFLCDVLNNITIDIPITVSIPVSVPALPKRDAEATGEPPANSPKYTDCSFIQQIGAINIFACDVLNNIKIDIPISVSIPVTL
ncbi:MAG: hypothetical protein GOMPHAMPRED_001654 [Gomphillus americanus]|uniref:Hydrophobin n=1 Tax=Gomphillus americanus TaxID=1940652 RepID=A0A8H3FDT4_9LECA|nr:MAG: hypothetical protein GOMPHAMPRED_001654 [Gomphillus americanus]